MEVPPHYELIFVISQFAFARQLCIRIFQQCFNFRIYVTDILSFCGSLFPVLFYFWKIAKLKRFTAVQIGVGVQYQPVLLYVDQVLPFEIDLLSTLLGGAQALKIYVTHNKACQMSQKQMKKKKKGKSQSYTGIIHL